MKLDLRDVRPITLKPFPSDPGYWVSDHGRVISTKKGKPKYLKPQTNDEGYVHHTLCKRGKLYTVKLQRMVLETFVGPRPEGLEGCHKDGDKGNNALWNLEYDTHAKNIADIDLHGHRNPPVGELNGQAKLQEADVRLVFELRRSGLTHEQIAQRVHVCRRQVGDILNGKCWSHVHADELKRRAV